MVAPLIARAARVTTQTARRTKAGTKRPELLRRIRARERRKQREQDPISPDEKQRQNNNSRQLLKGARKLSRVFPSNGTTERIQAIAASSLVLWSTLPFWIPQILLWMLGLVGLGVEYVPLVDIVAPGKEIFLLSYAVIVLIGICTMFYAAWIYTIRGVSSFKGTGGLVFAFSLALYMTIFLNFFPWILLWVGYVIFSKKKTDGAVTEPE